MDTTIITNVLFATLSIFLIFLIIGFTFFITFIISTLKKVNHLMNLLNGETEKIINDIDNARDRVKNGGMIIKNFVTHIFSFLKTNKKVGKKIKK